MLEAEQHPAVIPVVAPPDSYRVVEGEGSHIIDRSTLRIVQTPQVFQAATRLKAYEQPCSVAFTDDASVVEALGEKVYLVEGNRENIKLTTPSDLRFAEFTVINHDL